MDRSRNYFKDKNQLQLLQSPINDFQMNYCDGSFFVIFSSALFQKSIYAQKKIPRKTSYSFKKKFQEKPSQ